MNDDQVSWRHFREFTDIDLAQSFVLSWSMESEALLLDIDLHLLEAHPFYEKPRPAEKVCIRPACIEFPWCDAIQRDGTKPDGSLAEIADLLPIGRIEDLLLVAEGKYALSGEFGTVTVSSERPVLRLKGH